MKVLRIVVLFVVGLVAGYTVGIQRVRADCPPPLTCPVECIITDYICGGQQCGFFNVCVYGVGRCWWPDGLICSEVHCYPPTFCN